MEEIPKANLPEDQREQLRHTTEVNIVRGEQLLKTMEAGIQAMESGKPKGGPTYQHVPLAPILGFITMMVAWLLEVTVLVGRWISGGQWPGPLKTGIATGVFVLATIYHLTLRKKHRKYDSVIGSAAMNARLAITVLVWVVILGGFLGWMAFS